MYWRSLLDLAPLQKFVLFPMLHPVTFRDYLIFYSVFEANFLFLSNLLMMELGIDSKTLDIGFSIVYFSSLLDLQSSMRYYYCHLRFKIKKLRVLSWRGKICILHPLKRGRILSEHLISRSINLLGAKSCQIFHFRGVASSYPIPASLLSLL